MSNPGSDRERKEKDGRAQGDARFVSEIPSVSGIPRVILTDVDAVFG